MTDYVTITDTEIEPKKPITTSLLSRLRDNLLGVAEGRSNAPRIKPVAIHIQAQYSSGTGGGTINSGAYRTRPLNTILYNDISGASLTSDRVTLPAGEYSIRARATGQSINSNKLRWFNFTDSTAVIIGMPSQSGGSGNGDNIYAELRGRFTIAASKAFELQHRVATSNSATGMGTPSSFGDIEIYTDLYIEKIG